MTDNRILRRCVGLGLTLAALLHGCGSEDAPVAGGPSAARRVAEGCEPVAASREYQELVGNHAMAILSWTGMSEDAANLEIPVYVVEIGEGTIGVRFLEFPMREHYLLVWLGSGHIEAGRGDVFRLRPCSASLVPWP